MSAAKWDRRRYWQRAGRRMAKMEGPGNSRWGGHKWAAILRAWSRSMAHPPVVSVQTQEDPF